MQTWPKSIICQVRWTLTAWPRSTKQQTSHTRSNLTCTVRSLLSCFLVISEETCKFLMLCMPSWSCNETVFCHPSTSPIFSFLCHSPLLGDSLVSLDRKVPQGPSFFSGHRLGSWRMCKSWIWTMDVYGKNMQEQTWQKPTGMNSPKEHVETGMHGVGASSRFLEFWRLSYDIQAWNDSPRLLIAILLLCGRTHLTPGNSKRRNAMKCTVTHTWAFRTNSSKPNKIQGEH